MTGNGAMPPAIPKDERTWGMFCHLAALAGFLGNGIGCFLGPLIVWLIKKDEYPFVNEQGKEALNFQITMFLAGVVAAALCFVLIGIPLLIIIAAADLILPIVAGIKANEGVHYRYPFTIRLID